MMTLRHFAAPLLALAAFAPLPTLACSVVDGYRVPTNLELAEQADLIVLGRVAGFEPAGKDGGIMEGAVLVEPVESIKGALPEGTLRLRGMMIADAEQSERGFDTLSNPYELTDAHPLSYIGGCVRYIFARDTTALFFLTSAPDGWRPAGGPFSRWAEDVLSEDTPWLLLAKLYAEASELPDAERDARLTDARDRFASLQDDIVPRLMAADIDRQLAGPNPPVRGRDKPREAAAYDKRANAMEAEPDAMEVDIK